MAEGKGDGRTGIVQGREKKQGHYLHCSGRQRSKGCAKLVLDLDAKKKKQDQNRRSSRVELAAKRLLELVPLCFGTMQN